jgi:hypothetical protein
MLANNHLPPITGHFIVFLDIDKTLVFSRTYGAAEMITYTADYQTWVSALTKFQFFARTQGFLVHYGIATLKKRRVMEQTALIGDNIYGQIMGDPAWNLHTKCSYSNSLRKLISPKLVFLLGEQLENLSKNVTDEHRQALIEGSAADFPSVVCAGDKYYLLHDFFQCKAVNAMEVGRKLIEQEYKITIPQQQVVLIDDSTLICEAALQRNFTSYCVHNIQEAAKPTQIKIINLIFEEFLPNQLNEVHSPRTVQHVFQDANRTILSILNPNPALRGADAKEIISTLEQNLPGHTDSKQLKFFKPKPADTLAQAKPESEAKQDNEAIAITPLPGFSCVG